MFATQSDQPLPQRHGSGRYQYKNWAHSAEGARIAVVARTRADDAPSTLINTAYRNSDGSRTVFGIAFDFDAERADVKWKDASGALAWNKIRDALFKKHPEVLQYITHVTQSTGGKGFGVILSIAPLPIRPTTQKNQTTATSLQSRLISLFSGLGFGADPSARGLVRDTPNFNDPSRVIYRDEITKRRIEKNSEPVISKLHDYLNEHEKKHRNENRLYPDARVETGLAHLFLLLLGAGKARVNALRTPLFLSCDTVFATTQQLTIETGLGEKFLRDFLSDPPKWLKSAYYGREGWELRLNITDELSVLWERSLALVKNPQSNLQSASVVVRDLKLPWDVEDGERNQWLTSLALLYKWHGYSEEAAKQKIILRMQELVGFERSRNCKQLRLILKSIYARMPETFGMHSFRELPEWIRSDDTFCSLIGRLSARRGVTPSALPAHRNLSPQNIVSSPELHLIKFDLTAEKITTILHFGEDVTLKTADRSIVEIKRTQFVAIRYKQKVGIFENKKLIICLTRRHYKASNVIDWLSGKPEYAHKKISIFSPKKAAQNRYFHAVENSVAVSAAQICGKKKTAREKFGEWRDKKGIHFSSNEPSLMLFVDEENQF